MNLHPIKALLYCVRQLVQILYGDSLPSSLRPIRPISMHSITGRTGRRSRIKQIDRICIVIVTKYWQARVRSASNMTKLRQGSIRIHLSYYC